MHVISAGNVSTRIAWLIESHDDGDQETAGRRLGIVPERLDGLLSGDWRRFSLEALAKVVRGYGVSIDELFGSGTRARSTGLPVFPTAKG